MGSTGAPAEFVTASSPASALTTTSTMVSPLASMGKKFNEQLRSAPHASPTRKLSLAGMVGFLGFLAMFVVTRACSYPMAGRYLSYTQVEYRPMPVDSLSFNL